MDTQVMLERAVLLMDQGRYKDAETHIRQVLEQEPENDHALSQLGRCYLNTKQYDKGIEIIEQAIAIEPNESFYFYLLGFGYYQKSDAFASATNLAKAIEMNPYVAEYFGLFAFVLIEQKRFQDALEKANEGLALDADNVTCLNARSTALNKMHRTEDAINTMNNALAKDPDNEVTHTTIGWNLLERGRHKDAQNHFMEALRLDPNYPSARIGLKEALKSKILLYKWLLQYSFWVHNKGRNFQIFIPIALYIVFRILIKASEANENTASVAWVLGGIYIFIIVTSWTIGSIANFVLLFHPLGRHALSNTEKWSAINAVSALVAGIAIMLLSGLTTGTRYEEGSFMVGMICLSLALPLGHIEYPIHLKGQNWKAVYAVCLIGLGLAGILLFLASPFFLASPSAFMPLFVLYVIGFLIYNWAGVVS
jgi:tetratricopeptide (TPR) repeat protein